MYIPSGMFLAAPFSTISLDPISTATRVDRGNARCREEMCNINSSV